MKFLGVGPVEFILIVLVAILVLGPDGIVKSSRNFGRVIRDIKKSGIWKGVQDSKDSFTKLSKEFVEDSGINEIKDEISELNSMRDKYKIDIEKELISSQSDALNEVHSSPEGENGNG